MSTLIEAIHAIRDLAGKPCAVMGDIMLDRYIGGEVHRISPDAPIPVVRVQDITEKPGGAANVAENIAALGIRPVLLGVAGEDEEGRKLRERFGDTVILDSEHTTTLKTTIVATGGHNHRQKIVRLDREKFKPVAPRHIEQMIASVPADCSYLIVQDYAKGLLTHDNIHLIMRLAAERGLRLVANPKIVRDTSASEYAQCHCLKLNRFELSTIVGCSADDIVTPKGFALADEFRKNLSLEALVVTCDRHGALLACDEDEPELMRTRKRDIHDVVGAGDTFMAMLTIAALAGTPWRAAAELATAAATLKVEKFGTAVVSLDEVAASLAARDGSAKIIKADALPALRQRYHDRSIVFTNGCFDVFHAGHAHLLAEAKAFGDKLVVGVNSDKSISELKGPTRPVMPQAHRLKVLASMEAVDYIVVFEESTPMNLLEKLRPDVLVKGGEHTVASVVGSDLVLGYGGVVKLVEMVPTLSSTNAIEKMST